MPNPKPNMESKKVCTRCDKPATIQTDGGKYQEEIGGHPINHGWYCDKCYKEGLEIEREARYG